MNEDDLEAQIMAVLGRQGYRVKRAASKDRGADLYVEGHDGRKIAIEVKDRQIGVPDVLSVASSNYRGTFGKGSAPVIVSSGEVLPLAERVALENGVMVVRSEGQDIDPRIRFVDSFTSLVELLVKSERIQTRNPIQVIEHATRLPFLTPADLDALRRLLDTRNNVAHQREISEVGIEAAIASCKALIAKVAQFTR